MTRGKVYKQSLFFNQTTTPATEAEAANFTSASATGARVAGAYYGWAEQARQELAKNDVCHLKEWAGVQPAVPEWLDTEHPDHAWHLICLVAQGLPKYVPAVGNLTPSEQRAAEVLLKLSRVQEAVRPFADRLELVFPLIEASISLGSEVVAATVEPYERYAAAKLKGNGNFKQAGRESNQQRHEDSQEKYAVWQREANKIWAKDSSKGKANVAQIIKKSLSTKESADTIRKVLERPS